MILYTAKCKSITHPSVQDYILSVTQMKNECKCIALSAVLHPKDMNVHITYFECGVHGM